MSHGSRERSRSPRAANPKEWDLKYVSRESDSKLDRHRDARRSMKPAWMTKGVGCGQEMFGTPKGIIKPGDDLKVEVKERDPNEPDPMGDVYRSVVTNVRDGKDVNLPASKDVNLPASKDVNLPANLPASKDVNLPASKDVNLPASQEVNLPSSKDASQKASEDANQGADAKKPVAETGNAQPSEASAKGKKALSVSEDDASTVAPLPSPSPAQSP